MAFLDWSLILDYILALAVVALPVEAGILVLINNIRRTISSPEKRAELIHEAAAQLWEPLKEPEQRKKLIGEVAQKIWEPFKTPEDRQKIISEVGHGLLRAVKENAGSMKGAAVRSDNAALMNAGEGLGALAAMSGKTIELPIIGKTTIPQALQLFSALRGIFSGGGLQLGNALQGAQSSAGSGSASNLP
jgi:hypothetical protein